MAFRATRLNLSSGACPSAYPSQISTACRVAGSINRCQVCRQQPQANRSSFLGLLAFACRDRSMASRSSHTSHSCSVTSGPPQDQGEWPATPHVRAGDAEVVEDGLVPAADFLKGVG